MTEKIKEILDRLQDSVNYPKIDMPTFDGSDSEYIDNDTLLEPSKCKLLLNYITNLQKENEKLIKIIDELERWLKANDEHYAEAIPFRETLRKLIELKGETKK